jgi:hypothetical protein
MMLASSRPVACAALIATASAMAGRAASAQVKPSEHGMVAQTVDGTTITIEYDRPVARGRDSLFGKVVKLDQLWTPGANWATTIEVSKNVQLDGHTVPDGKYSLWMIPRATDDWTVVLSRSARRFHTQRPDSSDDLLRYTVRPEHGPHAEVLTWSFPMVTSEGTTLQFQWGTTMIPLRITVQPTRTRSDTSDARTGPPG